MIKRYDTQTESIRSKASSRAAWGLLAALIVTTAAPGCSDQRQEDQSEQRAEGEDLVHAARGTSASPRPSGFGLQSQLDRITLVTQMFVDASEQDSQQNKRVVFGSAMDVLGEVNALHDQKSNGARARSQINIVMAMFNIMAHL